MNQRSVGAVLVGLLITLLAGQALGHPVLLSYVETGSMAPTFAPGDGFVVVPPELTGGVEVGDIVVYRAVGLGGGGLTTHRVVGDTPRGYLTRGDANAFTDQAGGEPPVQAAQVVGAVVAVGGHPVVLPGLGTLVGGLRTGLANARRGLGGAMGLPLGGTTGDLGLGLSILGIGLFGYGRWRSRQRPSPPTARIEPPPTAHTWRRSVLLGAALVVLGASAGMVIPGGIQAIDLVSAEVDAPGPRVIKAGTTETTDYPVRNGGLLPTYVVLDPQTPGIDVRPRELLLAPGERRTVTVTLTAPRTIGHHREVLVDHRYLAVLPVPLLERLSAVHPWVPVVVIDAVAAGATLGVGYWLLGRRTARLRGGPPLPTPGRRGRE